MERVEEDYTMVHLLSKVTMPSKRKRDISFNLSLRANARKFLVTFGGFKDVEHSKLDVLRITISM